MTSRFVRVALAFTIMLLIGSGSGLIARAQTDDSSGTIWFVIAPDGKANGDYFDIELSAGQSATLSGFFGNGSRVPVTAIVYAADALSGINGGFALNDANEPISAPTTWLDFPTEIVDFQPEELLRKSFTLTVPEGTPPGQYITGVAIETAEATAPAGGASFLVKYRLVAAILITVPGPVAAEFAVSDIDVQVDEFAAIVSGTIENSGNVRVRPTGSVVIVNESGVEVATAAVAMGSVYAGHSTIFRVTLAAPIPEGSYTANVELHDPDTGATASLRDVALDVTAPEALPPVSIASTTITPMPSADNVVFAQVTATVNNTAAPVAGVEVAIIVFRDGEEVDTRVLATSVTLQSGDTTIDQPYIPATGSWESGTYTFAVTLTAIDPASGSRTSIASVDAEESILVP